MKLTARKKNILWGIILLILLIIITVIVLSTSVSQKEELSLKQVRTQAVSEVQNSLNNKSVKMADLLTKMKEQQILSSGAKELKDCFEKVDSLDKLNDLKKKVLTIVNNLSTTPGPDNPTPSPGPTGPNNPPSPSPQPPQPNPIPNPQPQPENK